MYMHTFRSDLLAFIRAHSSKLEVRNDADSMFFVRQLEQELTKEYDKEFPEYTIANGSLLPMDSEVDPGAESYVYYFVEPTGMARIMNTYADTDIPEIGLAGKRTVGTVVPIGAAYGWSFQDLRTAAFAKRDIKTRKGNASKQAHMQQWNALGWFGSPARGVYGLLTHPNITHTLAPLNVGLTFRTWANKTFEEILLDVGTLINTPEDLTNGIEKVDTVVIASRVWRSLNTRILAAANSSNVNIQNFLTSNFPGVTFIEEIVLDAANHASTELAGKNLAVAFRKDPDKVSFVLPQPYEQFAPQEKLFRVLIPTHSRCGGVKIPAPLSVHVLQGI